MIRITAFILFLGAVFGITIGILGLYEMWQIKPAIARSADESVVLAQRTLTATDDLLKTVLTSLDNTSEELTLMRGILDATAETIGQSSQALEDTSSLLGDDLPEILKQTQASLTNTEKTAKLIDDLLTTITNIPLIGPSIGSRYRPDVPLSTSVAQINLSLDPLNASMFTLRKDLQNATAGITTIKGEMSALSMRLSDLEKTIKQARAEVGQYQIILADAHDKVDALQIRLQAWINTGALVLTLVMAWIIFSQLGMLLLSLTLIFRPISASAL